MDHKIKIPVRAGGLPKSVGTVIVGGGLSGVELARELDAAGASSVLLLEAGPGDDLSHINFTHDPDRALEVWLTPGVDPHFWRPWEPENSPHYDHTSGLRRRLGGRSLYWHGVLLPLEEWAMVNGGWPESVVHDLTVSWRGGPSLYDRVRADIDAWQGEEGSPTDGLVPITVGEHTLVPTPQAVRGNAWNNGLRWRAYSPVDMWTAENVRRSVGGVHVVTETEALGVDLENGAVTGITVRGPDGDSSRIDCARVVLAAGTIESTRLAIQAMRSAGALEDELLDGLVDHLVQGFVAFVDPEAVPAELRELAEKDVFYVSPCDPTARSNLFMRVYRNSAGSVVFDVWTMGEQMPGTTGTVRCADGDSPRDEVFVRAGLGAEDHEVLEHQRVTLRTFWRELAKACGREAERLKFPKFDDPDSTLETLLPELDSIAPSDWAITWSGPLGSEYHEACTLPLGRILDTDHRFHGVDGLFATGPAIFPRSGAANPSLTTLALSKRLAGLLMDRM